MKSLPVSADLVTWLLTGPTRLRASPIFHPKVSPDSWHICANALWARLITCPTVFRVRIPAVSRRELCPGPDRCLHSGGWQTVPLCLQPHHQRQACKSSPVLNCVLTVCYPSCIMQTPVFKYTHKRCLVIVSERVGKFSFFCNLFCVCKTDYNSSEVCVVLTLLNWKSLCHRLVCNVKVCALVWWWIHPGCHRSNTRWWMYLIWWLTWEFPQKWGKSITIVLVGCTQAA